VENAPLNGGEHKLIRGGEQYLPFARSRIKALRANGAQYASQKYIMPGGEQVEVQIVGPQSFIRITGGQPAVFSGVIRNGDIVSLPIPPGSPPGTVALKTLRDYMPTQQAWEYLLRSDPAKSPTTFNDEKRLAQEGRELDDLCSSMFSGTMTKVVQFVLGYEKNAAQVEYDFKWLKCHGVVTGADGKKWLLEISESDGVRAMKLPLRSSDKQLATHPQDVLRQTYLSFGGLPSGKTFPTGAKLAAAVAAGNILQLLSAAEMDAVFSKSTYSTTMGWSFNDSGSEAHNTCYALEDGVNYGYHYKLDIAIGAELTEREPNTPIATFSCTLSQVGRGALLSNSFGRTFSFANSTNLSGGGNALMPITLRTPGEASSSSTVIFVCHINNVLETVTHKSVKYDATGLVNERIDSYSTDPPWAHNESTSALHALQFWGGAVQNVWLSAFDYVESSRHTYPRYYAPRNMVTTWTAEQAPTSWASYTLTSVVDDVEVTTEYTFYYWRDRSSGPISGNQGTFGRSLIGVRDGYVMLDANDVIQDSVVQGVPYATIDGSPFGPQGRGTGWAPPTEAYPNGTISNGVPDMDPPWPLVEDMPSYPTVTTHTALELVQRLITSGATPERVITTPYPTLSEWQTAHERWGSTSDSWPARRSTFGPNDQLVHARVPFEWDVSGSMLDAQPDENPNVFSFIGYI